MSKDQTIKLLPERASSPQEATQRPYWIGVKFEVRDLVPTDWQQQLKQIEGLEVNPKPGKSRVRVLATEEAIQKARAWAADFFHVEQETRRG